jgi:hypothetical protein
MPQKPAMSEPGGSPNAGRVGESNGAKGGSRTPKAFRLPDPKSGASASSATFASNVTDRNAVVILYVVSVAFLGFAGKETGALKECRSEVR